MPRAAAPLVLALVLACNHPPVAPVTSAAGSVTATDITIGGAPPPEQFADEVVEHTNAVVELAERCYLERLEARPDVGGEHRLLVYVSAAQVIRVTVEESTLEDPVLEDCVKQEILRYELPPDAPRGGVRVRFRLVFTSPGAR